MEQCDDRAGHRLTARVDDGVMALRRVLLWQRDDSSTIAHLREPMADLCAGAREDGVPPERLLARLKETLRMIPRRPDGGDDDMRERIVSLMISAYYASGDAHA